MLKRHSSRRQPLDAGFLSPRLAGARSYDRIAGYFSSSILEVAGEALESVEGKIRIVCNSQLAARRRRSRKGRPGRHAPRVVRFPPRRARRRRPPALPAAPRFPAFREDRGPHVARRLLRTDPRQGGDHHSGERRADLLPRQRERDPGGVPPQLRARLGGRFAGGRRMGAGGVRRPLVLALRGPARGLRRPGPRPPVPPRADRGPHPLEGRAGPGPRLRRRRIAGLPQGNGLVGAPEALREARLRCASRAARRALRAGRSGGAREDAAIGDGGAAHGPGRRRAGTDPRAEASSPAVAGRDGHPARAALGALEGPRLGGRVRDRASGRGRRIDPALSAPGRDRVHRPRHRQRRGRQMVGGDALRVRHPRRGAPGAAPEPLVRPPGLRACTAQQPPEVPPDDLAPHQEPAARDRHPGAAPSRGGIRSPRRPRPGLARGARRPRQPLAQRQGIPRSAARQRAPAHRFRRALGLAAQPLPSPLRREGLRDPTTDTRGTTTGKKRTAGFAP